MNEKTDYKSTVIGKFGTGAVEFPLADLKLKPGDSLPAEMADEKVWIKKLSGKQCMQLLAEWSSLKKDTAEDGQEVDLTDERYTGIQAELVAKCHAGPDGKLLWTSADECNEALSFEFLSVMFLACQQTNGLGGKQAQEEAEKNS